SLIAINTPFGFTPDPVMEGWVGNTRLLFVSRHGEGHRLLPSEVPYQAIIFALKTLGATHVIGVSAVGSLNEDIHPGDLAVVRQYSDATYGRPDTFFGNGIAGHIEFANPVCPDLADIVGYTAKLQSYGKIHDHTTLRVMQGPAFSTRAESEANRQMGYHLIGMTSLSEAKLAREAELCYVTLALVTDFDCWHNGHDTVSAEMVTTTMARNVRKATRLVLSVAEAISAKRNCGCSTALDTAIVTDRALIPDRFSSGDMFPIFSRVLSAK
ncbi:MAG: MTAP family purine nucleoside phosphorylase, partial [Patescibacteria group bacterium]